MIKINLSPTAKKAPKVAARAAKPAVPQLKLPTIKASALLIVGIVVVVIIIAFFLLIQSTKIGKLNREIENLNAKLTELDFYVKTVDSLEKREKDLLTLISPIKVLNRNRFLIAHILDEVSARIPDFTWLTMMNITTSDINIQGTTASNLLVADFMNRLDDSPYIKNVDLTVLAKKTIEKQEMMEFTLTAQVDTAGAKIDTTGRR